MEKTKADIDNIVNEGIMRGISVAFDNGCYGSAVVLIYAGIDAMAFLNMPEGQMDVGRADFVDWIETYMTFRSKHAITGLELYGARCGMVHKYGVQSKLSREGKVRLVGYVDSSQDEIMIDETGHSSLVLVSIRGLARAFSEAVQCFFDESWQDEGKREIITRRLRELVQCNDLPEELRHV